MAETIGILGAGAMGTLLAAKLGRAGHVVHLLVRSPIRREALRKESYPVQVEETLEGLGPATLVFVCVKSFDTAGAAAVLAGLPSTIGICSLQNGWGNLETLAARLPGFPLIAGTTSLGGYLDDAGVLHASTTGSTQFAPWEETEVRWAEYAVTLFESAGFRAELKRDARSILWQKLVLSAAVNPISALCGRPNGAILESPPLLRVAEAAAGEATRVGARLGYLEPTFDPSIALQKILEETKANRSSMTEDLARTRRTEIDAIARPIVFAGKETGEPVPVLEGLWALVRAAEANAIRHSP